MVRAKGIAVSIHVAITGSSNKTEGPVFVSQPESSESSRSSDSDDIQPIKGSTGCCCSSATQKKGTDEKNNKGCPSDSPCRGVEKEKSVSVQELIREYTCRPNIEAMIREPVEQAWGETGVVVCGGREIVARTRNCMSRLSDERAVHKGTGAQGIYLYVEEYSF
jgi:hypothetical protein